MDKIMNEEQLDEVLSIPSPAVIEMMKHLDGDLIILGINGKMGLTLGRQALNAIKTAGVDKKVIGVSRFTDPTGREKLEEWGIETIACDLLDRDSVDKLPQVKNIIFMAGRKFGTTGSEELTWAMNTIVPANVGNHFRDSRIVVFSTGCVYSLVSVASGGSVETDSPAAIGEYANSCLGRERAFEYSSKTYGAPTLLLRLNYAVDLRYGVLHDIAQQINNGEPVNNSVGCFNVLWQGDANAYALLALEQTASPAVPLNITGPETVSIAYAATRLAEILDKPLKFAGEAGERSYLNNAAKSFALFGYPRVSLDWIIRQQAEWIKQGNRSLNKPTHFEVNDGKF
jgi:nucleoside-diphosphate-sugar epimerase